MSTTTRRLPHRPADHLGVVDHLVHGNRQRGIVPLHDHRHAVADENPFDPRLIDQLAQMGSRRR